MGRHAWSVVKHSTPRKLVNLARIEYEFRTGALNVKGKPYIVIIDPLNVCNLRCPLCPTGLNERDRAGKRIEWDTFTRLVDAVSPYAYEINLHNWGESILHPHIFDMIEYVRDRNVATNMSTNFNLVGEKRIKGLVTSGLEYLTLSIDGATNETYKRYRVRGDLDRVLSNVRELVAMKKQLKSKTPFLEWQFIGFKNNIHEVEQARQMAKEIGVDRFRVISPGTPFAHENSDEMKKEWFLPSPKDNPVTTNVAANAQAQENEYHRDRINGKCFYLYRSFTMNPDGMTAPCCVVYGQKHDFGDINKMSFEEIWNSTKYQSARSLFSKRGTRGERTVCDSCDYFDKVLTTPPNDLQVSVRRS